MVKLRRCKASSSDLAAGEAERARTREKREHMRGRRLPGFYFGTRAGAANWAEALPSICRVKQPVRSIEIAFS
jgi:hypothetical protein